MTSLLLIAGGLLGWTVLVAGFAWRLGVRRGLRIWKADAERAYHLGVRQGRIEERAESEGVL